MSQELIQAVREQNYLLAKQLLEDGADVDFQSEEDGISALHVAAKLQRIDMIKLLMEYDADVFLRDERGLNALNHLVEEYDADTENAEAELLPTLKVLLRFKVPVNNTIEATGNTILHWAAWNGFEQTVRLLLQAGADPRIKKNDGTTTQEEALEGAELLKEQDVTEDGVQHFENIIILLNRAAVLHELSEANTDREATDILALLPIDADNLLRVAQLVYANSDDDTSELTTDADDAVDYLRKCVDVYGMEATLSMLIATDAHHTFGKRRRSAGSGYDADVEDVSIRALHRKSVFQRKSTINDTDCLNLDVIRGGTDVVASFV
ncbi:MAG: ankyrin repeat domain-containing protein [Legionellaceae bacterium]|nr:ankyrin repeat domain-containing protein [Legionellaceae bacterium]